MPVDTRLLGRLPYADGLALMRDLATARAAGTGSDILLIAEHDPVYTRGRRRDEDETNQPTVEVMDVERGGRITYHGPGQCVAYPIVQLTGEGRDLHRWLRLHEQVVIECLAEFDLEAHRDPLGTGVFVGPRKIASIGIAVRRWVSLHGLALNVTTDLAAFEAIRPCGFDPEIMTNLERELGPRPCPTLDEVGAVLGASFERCWDSYPR